MHAVPALVRRPTDADPERLSRSDCKRRSTSLRTWSSGTWTSFAAQLIIDLVDGTGRSAAFCPTPVPLAFPGNEGARQIL